MTEKPETNVTAKPPEETDTCKGLVPSLLLSSSKFIHNHKQTHQPLAGFVRQEPGMWVTECDLVYQVADTVQVKCLIVLLDSTCSQLCVGNGTCACLDGYQLQKDGVNCEGEWWNRMHLPLRCYM